MLHLVQINLIIYAVAAIAVLTVRVFSGAPVETALQEAIRYGGAFSIATVVMTSVGWRFVPFLGRVIFPNIAGEWTGSIEFNRAGSTETTDASLHVEQNLLAMSLILLTPRAESETLVVHPLKLTNGRFAIHYIYDTRSRPGQAGPVYKYRGTAELRLGDDGYTLAGTYYTEQNNGGTVHFTRPRKPRCWWQFWH